MKVRTSPAAARAGPLTTNPTAALIVVAYTPWQLNSSLQTASSAASTTGMQAAVQPASTAFTATFSTVALPISGGTTATTSVGSRRVPRSIPATRAGVGATTGRPSVNPAACMNSCSSSPSPISTARLAKSPPLPPEMRGNANSGAPQHIK